MIFLNSCFFLILLSYLPIFQVSASTTFSLSQQAIQLPSKESKLSSSLKAINMLESQYPKAENPKLIDKTFLKKERGNDFLLRNILGVWGVTQVILIFGNALKRVIPVALQPIKQNDLDLSHWVLYLIWCVFMSYTEGYKAFHLKFSPLVVSRAFNLIKNPSFVNYIFSGPYSMGMFGADKKRMIVSWSITLGIFALVKIVKYLPYPYRSIVDGGVVLGLSIGVLSMVYYTIKALFGYEIPIEEIETSKRD